MLDIKEAIASVKVDSNKFTDYLLMIKENGQWKIVDALWAYHK
ncbi:MAG: nuclear transport factor 2 family protein [Candidatus Heimdallarchaeota archaeon]